MTLTKGPFHGVNQNTANRHISCLLQWEQPIISSDFHRRHFESQKRGHFQGHICKYYCFLTMEPKEPTV